MTNRVFSDLSVLEVKTWCRKWDILTFPWLCMFFRLRLCFLFGGIGGSLRIFGFCAGLLLVVGLSGFFIAFASVVGLVKAATLEDQGAAATDQPSYFILFTFRTFPDGFGGNQLKLLKRMVALVTKIFISRHIKSHKG